MCSHVFNYIVRLAARIFFGAGEISKDFFWVLISFFFDHDAEMAGHFNSSEFGLFSPIKIHTKLNAKANKLMSF